MSNEPNATITGNATRDPELKFTHNGTAVTTFTLASTPRRYDRQTNQWVDGDTLFMRCTAFGKLAENLAETVTKGARVIATGRLAANRWTDKNGQPRESTDLHIDDAGLSALYPPKRAHTTPPQTRQDDGWGNTPNPPAPF